MLVTSPPLSQNLNNHSSRVKKLCLEVIQSHEVIHHPRTQPVVLPVIAVSTKDPLPFFLESLALVSLLSLSSLPCKIAVVPVFCGKVISPRVSCGRELVIRRIGGKGRLESMELETSRSVALASRATTVVTAHTVWGRQKRNGGKFRGASEEWKSELLYKKQKIGVGMIHRFGLSGQFAL